MNVDSSKTNAAQANVEKLNHKLKNQSIVKSAELDNVNKLYDKKIEDARVEGYKELSSEKQRTQNQLREIYDQREEKLEDLKGKLQQTAKSLELEKQNIESEHENQIRDMRLTQDVKLENQFQRDLDEAKSVNAKTNDMIAQVKRDYRERLDEIENETQHQIMQAQAKHERKRLGVDKDLQKSDAAINTENRMAELRVEKEQQNSLDEIKGKYNDLESEHELIHQKKLEKQQENGQQALTQKEKAFQLKHDRLIKEHQELMKTTRAKLENEFQKLVDQHTEARKTFESRSNDEFYNIKSIDPQVKDVGDAYVISLEVPEHERDQVIVAPQKRELRVSLNRNFKQRVESPDGQIHKNSRSEMISRTISTPEIMDAGTITEKYEDGVLSFKIAKA